MGPDYSKGSVPLHLFNFDSRNVCRKGHVFREGFYMDLFFTLEQIISALPQLYGREAEVIVRCTKMLHNRRDYLRRRAKVRQSS